MPSLVEPIDIRGLRCPNRVFMAPLTRQRAYQPGDVPGELQAEHYAQRASFGLLIAEATWITREGKGYPCTPGIETPEQVAGWRTVTDRVHAAGGRIFLQLWHVGRVSHSSWQPGGGAPVSCVAKASNARITVIHPDGTRERVPATLPRALRTDEMPRVVEDYAHAARNAKAAGFDGVEIHAANSYLIDQFMSGTLNDRDDEWGGCIENRLRLLLQATDAAARAFGHSRVGVRLSPLGSVSELPPAADDRERCVRAARELGRAGCAYLHLYNHHLPQHGWDGPFDHALAREMRQAFGGPVVMNGYGRDVAAAQRDLDLGIADAVAFGKLAISNPDLPARIAAGTELAGWDESTFYGDGARGYNDYPAMAGGSG
jgi:N-ethylmaleimide reductase